MDAIGYIRVSTDDQTISLAAQQADIEQWCRQNGHRLLTVYGDEQSGANTARPGLNRAKADLTDGMLLVVARLDRLDRSVAGFARTAERARARGWRIVCLDMPDMDPTTPTGEVMIHIAAVFAQYERRLISERTKRALAEKRARGEHLGRAVDIHPSIVQRIREMRADGWSLRMIAERFELDRIPAPRGTKWHPSTIMRVS